MKGCGVCFLAGLCLFVGTCMSWLDMVVTDAVANLRLLDDRGFVTDRFLSCLVKDHEKDGCIYDRAPSVFYRDNPQQETQLLFGEHVLAEPFSESWFRVQVLEQSVFKEGVWQSLSGFVRASQLAPAFGVRACCLIVASPWAQIYQQPDIESRVLQTVSLGTCLSGLGRTGEWCFVDTPVGRGAILARDVVSYEEPASRSDADLRTSLIATAKLFLNSPYVWGGCSAWIKYACCDVSSLTDFITGVDCSGLMYLVFKTNGLLIARNAHDQFLMSSKVSSGDLLQPGDVIFFANPRKTPARVTHVMLYLGCDHEGRDLILEANGGNPQYGVRIVPTCECHRFGYENVREIVHGQKIHWELGGDSGDTIIYLGTFLTAEKRAELHKAFLQTVCYNKR